MKTKVDQDNRKLALDAVGKMLALLGPSGENFSPGSAQAVDVDGHACVADGRFASRWSLFGAFLRCHSWIVNMTDVWHLIHLELPVAAPRTGLDAVSVLMNAQKALAPQEAQH